MQTHSSIRALLPVLTSLLVFPAVFAGCSSGTDTSDEQFAVSADNLKGGGGGRGNNKCTGTPVATVTPNPVALGSTGVTIGGTGFCGVGAVLVNVMSPSGALQGCYPGDYVYNGAFSIAWPYNGFGSSASYTFTTAGTYTAGVWQAIFNADGSISVGSQLATTTFTVQ